MNVLIVGPEHGSTGLWGKGRDRGSESAQQLTALAALALASPQQHTEAHKQPYLQFRRIQHLLLACMGTAVHAHM